MVLLSIAGECVEAVEALMGTIFLDLGLLDYFI
jgi:hypothetical protein